MIIKNAISFRIHFFTNRREYNVNTWNIRIQYNTGIRNGQEIIEAIEEKLNMWIRPSIHDED